MQMEGESTIYRGEDVGAQTYLAKIIAPKVLHLKRGCPVMLLWNLSDRLVNGSLGTVVDFTKEGPVVDFTDAQRTLEIKPILFSGRCLNTLAEIYWLLNSF
jgi:hypothetical protein